MYQLIALDMDGTLLTSDKTISERTRQAITAARENGVKVVLASGRPLDGMQQKLDELNIQGDNEYVVYFNGSMVKELGSGKVIHQATINGQQAKQVAKLADELGLYVHAFSTELGLITPQLNPYTEHEATMNNVDVTEVDFDSLSDDHQIIKAMIVGAGSDLDTQIANIPAHYYQEFTIVRSADIFLEFLNLDANKGVGVQAIAEQLGLNAEQVICMGDAENDHHMLHYAGLGVAMENAMEETKAIANHITTSNDQHGVAKVIEDFVLCA